MGVCAASPPGRSRDFSLGRKKKKKTHLSCLKKWVAFHQLVMIFFSTGRIFQGKGHNWKPAQLHAVVFLSSCGFVNWFLARFAFSWINNSECHLTLRLDPGPGNLVTHKPHRATIGMAVALGQGCCALPASTHNSLPSISASCSAFSIDRYLYIIPGCNKCFRDLHCNFNHKV